MMTWFHWFVFNAYQACLLWKAVVLGDVENRLLLCVELIYTASADVNHLVLILIIYDKSKN